MRNFIVLAASLSCLPVLAADPAPLDAKYLRTHAETRGFMLGRPTRPKPTLDGKAVLFLRAQPRKAKLALFEFDVASGKTRELLTPEQVLKGAEEKLTPEEKARRERMRVGVGGFTDYQLSTDGRLILLSLSGKLYVVTRGKDEVRELKTGDGTLLDPKFSPDGKWVSYVRDNDVYVYDLATDKEKRVTTGGTAQKTHGLAEFVAQEEMDRSTGYWWSPDSQDIAYEEADADGVEVWHVADPSKPEQPGQPSFYPRPGKKNVSVRVGIVPIAGGKTKWIDWDAKKYPYLTQVHWDKQGPLTITAQTRDQKELALFVVEWMTGKTRRLVVDKDPAWVNLHQDVPQWTNKGFLWTTESAGGPQLEHRDPDGKLERVVLKPDTGFAGLVPYDSDRGRIAYRQRLAPTRVAVRVISLDPKENEQIFFGVDDSVNTVVLNPALSVLTSTTPTQMPRSFVVHYDDRGRGTSAGELPSVAEEPGFTPRVEFVTVGDKPMFHAAIVRPRDFDEKKKYPVIVDVYGGPGHQTVMASMRNWLLPQFLADQGFIVVGIDNRGTPARGRDWERAIYQKFGSVPLDDQVAGLQALGKKVPQMDLERVGIVGWSFGGYMAALAVMKRPDIFKAGVAGAPVTDWYDYDTHYTERYLGVPKDKDDPAYKEASLLTYAKDLKRPLLLMHGTADDNVYFRHTLKLADALFREGKDFEVLPLSGLTHMVPDPVVMERLWTRVAGYFQKHLGKPVAR